MNLASALVLANFAAASNQANGASKVQRRVIPFYRPMPVKDEHETRGREKRAAEHRYSYDFVEGIFGIEITYCL